MHKETVDQYYHRKHWHLTNALLLILGTFLSLVGILMIIVIVDGFIIRDYIGGDIWQHISGLAMAFFVFFLGVNPLRTAVAHIRSIRRILQLDEVMLDNMISHAILSLQTGGMDDILLEFGETESIEIVEMIIHSGILAQYNMYPLPSPFRKYLSRIWDRITRKSSKASDKASDKEFNAALR